MLAPALLIPLLLGVASTVSSMRSSDSSPDGVWTTARHPSDSPALNHDLDGLIARVLVKPERPSPAFTTIVAGLDAILARLRPELDDSDVFQQTTAKRIAKLHSSSSLQRAFSFKNTQTLSSSERFKFIHSFLRTTQSTAYWKMGALLMAITPEADLCRRDIPLLATAFHCMPTASIEVLAPLAFVVANRIVTEPLLADPFLVEGADYEVLSKFYHHVLIRTVPARHFLVHADADDDDDGLAHPGPVVASKAVRDILAILLMWRPAREVEAITAAARSILRPRPWAQLFLDGALRVYRDGKLALQQLYGPVHARHLLGELAVRAYRPGHVLLLVMMTEKFQAGAMASIPRAQEGLALQTLADDLTGWFRAQRRTAPLLLLSHMDGAGRLELFRHLLVLDRYDRDSCSREDVVDGFWSQLPRLRFYGELHYAMMGCRELHAAYKALAPFQMVRVILAVAAWNESIGRIVREDGPLRDKCDHCTAKSMDANISDMIAGQLVIVRISDMSELTESDKLRCDTIEELIALSWVAVSDFDPIVKRAFETGPPLSAEVWANALDNAEDRVASRTYSLFSHVLARSASMDPDDRAEWQNALAWRIDDLDRDHMKELRERNSAFFENWPISVNSLRHEMGANGRLPLHKHL